MESRALGCRLDEEESKLEEAEHAYRQAIRLDPDLAHAHTNLGNLRYRAGSIPEARACYEQALRLDPSQPEGHYNMGFLDYEEGRPGDAVPRFRRAIAAENRFATG